MRLYTFLIVMGDSDFIVENCNLTDDQQQRLLYSESGMGFRGVECIHPKLEDNLITVGDTNEEQQLIRDYRGLLYTFDDVLTREQAIKFFE